MDKELKREIILENYQHPMHRGLVDDDSYIKRNTNNESCIDTIDMQIKVEDKIVKDIVFDGEACAICTSATSIIIRSLIGKNISEVKNIMDNYQNMINGEEYDGEVLGELIVYEDIKNQPNRRNCALLPSNAVNKIMEVVGNE